MGYRSEVAIKIYGTDSQNAEFKTRFEAELENLDDDDKEEVNYLLNESNCVDGSGFTDAGFLLYHDSIKWYDDYESIQFFIKMMSIAENELNLSGEYINLGEDDNDNEIYTWGDDCQYYLTINRSIGL